MNKNQGGKRQGSGAKLKYNEPTKVLTIRVPLSKFSYFKTVLKTMLIRYEA